MTAITTRSKVCVYVLCVSQADARCSLMRVQATLTV